MDVDVDQETLRELTQKKQVRVSASTTHLCLHCCCWMLPRCLSRLTVFGHLRSNRELFVVLFD